MSRLIRSLMVAAGLGAACLGSSVPAVADDVAPPPPNCSAADLAGIMTGVSAATSAYLFTHPDVNAFLSGLKNLPSEQRHEKIAAYFNSNPQVEADFAGIRAPSVDFHTRCGVAD